MIPGKLYVSVRQVSLGIWSISSENFVDAAKLLGTIEPEKPFVFIEFAKREGSLSIDNGFYALKVLNYDGIIGFTSFLQLCLFTEAKE